ncbi:MAG: hypothetical protein IKH34_08110 [Oscillospiraceae bacterium]|nr:hypothetical protein [Oscillospiraceae bacterium]
MNWEALTMKSRISCFNGGVCRNLLRRFWPLWSGYLVLLLFLLPVQLSRSSTWDSGIKAGLQGLVLRSGCDMIFVSFAMGIVTAMAVFGYLYNSRSCGLMHSLPIRRETLFLTVWITGFLPMLAAELLTALLTGALYLGRGLLLRDLLSWLWIAFCSNLIFYGLAVFCAMLTGSLWMLPVAYLALNLAAWAAEEGLREVLQDLVYGAYIRADTWFTWLSPAVWLNRRVYVSRILGEGWEILGLGWLAIYAGVGLLLSLLALLMYRRRHMECAGDTAAYPVLKPIFRCGMAIGTSLILASSVNSLLLGGSFHGRTEAFLLLGLLLLGAVLGWIAAEMLLSRSVRIFPGKWKGLALLCAVICLLTLSAEFDLTGYERRVPDPEQVETVNCYAKGDWTVRDPENIRELTALHRDLIEHKSLHEGEIHSFGTWVLLKYVMKDGSELERGYYLDSATPEEATDLESLEDLINRPELLAQRNLLQEAPTEENFYAAYFGYHWVDGEIDHYETVKLSAEEALDFYRTAVLPDREAGTLGRIWLLSNGRKMDLDSNVSFHMELVRILPGERERKNLYLLDLVIEMDSEACLAWIKEHTEIPVFPQRQLQQEAAPAPAVPELAAP